MVKVIEKIVIYRCPDCHVILDEGHHLKEINSCLCSNLDDSEAWVWNGDTWVWMDINKITK